MRLMLPIAALFEGTGCCDNVVSWVGRRRGCGVQRRLTLCGDTLVGLGSVCCSGRVAQCIQMARYDAGERYFLGEMIGYWYKKWLFL
jgi:hypothetical protein